MTDVAIGAHFTPSLLDAHTLERLFVNRHHHLDDAMGRIERAATSDERAGKLFVGPRGAGKTHLLSLVYHRARALPGFGKQFQLAWLPEDMWTISSLDDLAVEIVAALEPAFEPQNAEPVATIIDAARRHGPIVVLVENLDTVLDAIGSDGQRQLRALLENHRPLLLIATSTRLGQELLDQAEPFYGFFDTTTLEPFDVDDAARMLKRIAEVNGDSDLVERLDEPRAKNRLATVAHLAGGQPRVWALLGSGLTIERLDDLVRTLVERFDDLTPYYQQQLDRLSLNERRAVRALATADGDLTVSELAERAGIEPRSLAKTVTELRRKGWIVRRTGLLADLGDQRRSYYQLAEPLARLAFQLKEARGRPVSLIVEFLKAWFDHENFDSSEDASPAAARYRDAAHQSILTDAPLAVAKALSDLRPVASATDPTAGMFHPDPKAAVNTLAGPVLLELDDAIAAFEAGDPEPLLRQPPAISHLMERELNDVTPGRARLRLAWLGLSAGSAEHWVPRLQQLCTLLDGSARMQAAALLALHQIRCSNGGPADVLLGQVAASASEETAVLLLWLGEKLLGEREAARALPVLEAARVKALPEAQFRIAVALEASYRRSGRVQDVITLWESAHSTLQAAFGPHNPETLRSRNNLASAHLLAGELGRAIQMYEAAVEVCERGFGADHPLALTSRNNLACAYSEAGDLGRAIPMFEATVTKSERVYGPDHPETLATRNNLANAYMSAGDIGRATPILEAVLAEAERVLGPDHPSTLTARNNVAYAYESAGDRARAIPMIEAILSDAEKILGPHHPDTLTIRGNLAAALEAVGDLGRAIPMFVANLIDCERLLGSGHPNTVAARNNLAFAYGSAGDFARAIPLFEVALADSERVLGPDHPNTLSTRTNLALAYGIAGDEGRAVPMLKGISADCERVLGPDHPQTLIARKCLASTLDAAGEPGDAPPRARAPGPPSTGSGGARGGP